VPTFRGEDPQLSAEVSSSLFYRSYANQRYDLGLFRPLVEYLIEGEEDAVALPVRAVLQTVAPERVNLAFNHVSDLRQDFVSMLLGGANSIWTNIQLAETLARIVTSRPVEARLISRVLPREEETSETEVEELEVEAESPADPLPFKPEVRQAVLRGMEKVVSGGSGTATALLNELRALKAEHPQRDIRLFSKTGSPTILIPVPRRTSETLTQLMSKGLLILDGQTLFIQDGGSRVVSQPRRTAGRASFEQAVGRAIRKVGRYSPRLLRAILKQLDEFRADVADVTFANEESIPDEVPSPLMVVGQQLRLNRKDPLFTQSLEREKGAVYIFSLVSTPKGVVPTGEIPSPKVLESPETRVISVAIHLDVGPDSGVAVAAAEALLPVLSELLKPER
jgi:hypothetical protein